VSVTPLFRANLYILILTASLKVVDRPCIRLSFTHPGDLITSGYGVDGRTNEKGSELHSTLACLLQA